MGHPDGQALHHETTGAGRPLVLLHGGLGTTDMFARVAPALAAHRRLVMVDLPGHGRSPAGDRPLRFETMADDIAGLLRRLDLSGTDLLGYSLGGGVALRLAIQHPGLVRRLVLVSTPYRRDGWYPEVLARMDRLTDLATDRESPAYETHARVAPDPAGWSTLLARLTDLLGRDYDWSAEVTALAAPTMLVYADADSVRVEHMAAFFRLLGGGRRDAGWDGTTRPLARLAVLPGLTHYEIVTAPALPAVVVPFLTEPIRPPT
ncbi:alpha/beta fold hydrolase [Plantactinospora sp. GCM10030261]|uniref:alpha/beta fold hydrolase n=1 Tax=Plantactinospora sp. GCM10030261 TaxID=3273420 RepID=UPI00361D9945